VDIFAYSSPMLRSMSCYDRPSHQVYMYLFKRGGWQVQFPRGRPKDTAAAEIDVHRTESSPGVEGMARLKTAGRCSSTQLRPAEGEFTRGLRRISTRG
jgi:hypothetical protein